MRPADTARLVLLAAIWGASFLFNRITAPAIGPVLTAELRTLIAGIALAGLFRPFRLRRRVAAVVAPLPGGWHLQLALPFLLWAYAALSVTAGVLSVLNATSPMWGCAVRSAAVTGAHEQAACGGTCDRHRGRGARDQSPPAARHCTYPAVAAALAAAFSYGLIATYIRRWRATCPRGAWRPARSSPRGYCSFPSSRYRRPRSCQRRSSWRASWRSACCVAPSAYLLYFRLIADIGATRALTVTYLIPLFGVLWGALFLGEARDLPMLAGGVLVVCRNRAACSGPRLVGQVEADHDEAPRRHRAPGVVGSPR
jgi:drug/metabolite transporter (DMT)-like permease